jgi:hypothetical protein
MSVLTTSTAPASCKQIDYLKALGNERDWSAVADDVAATVTEALTGGRVSKAEASRAIDALRRCQPENASNEVALIASPATEEGMYLHDGQVYRAVRAKTTGNLYAKHLELTDTGDIDEDGKPIYSARFSYAAGIIRQLSVNDRMTDEAARAWGKLYSICIVCGAELTDPASISRGLGPVCAGKV